MTGRRARAGGARIARALVIAVGLAGAIGGCGKSDLDPLREPRPDPLPPSPIRPPQPLPSRPLPSGPVLARFAVIGDYGVDSEAEARVARMVLGWNPRLRDHDRRQQLSLGRAVDDRRQHRQALPALHRQLSGRVRCGQRDQPLLADGGKPRLGRGRPAPYLDYFTLPGNERYYDVVIGAVHLFAVDSDPREPDGNTEGSTQARWLQTALSASSSCFDVVYFHHPAYSSGFHGSYLAMRWPFETWGADVVFAGHDHVYERAKVGGIRHMTVGLSGNEIYPFNTPIPESEMRFSARRGALLATAREDGISFQFFSDDGAEIDSYGSFKSCRR